MFLDLTYDEHGDVDRVVLEPDKDEDPDELHNYSEILRVSNPAIQFCDRAKKGDFNYYDDDEYTLMLNRIKEFSKVFFNGRDKINVFQLAVILSEYILKTEGFAQIPERNPKDDEEDEDEDDNPFDD